MRARLLMMATGLIVGSSLALADKRIVDMTPGFEREVGTCAIQFNGVTKITTGATTLAPTLTGAEKDEITGDLEKLNKAVVLMKEYCDELGGMVAFLKANAATPYKNVEKDLDTRDNKIRKLRKDAKQTITDLNPITRKLIPRIARSGTPPPVPVEDKKVPAKFPSRRSIDLPALPGSWKLSGSSITDTAEYTDKGVLATVTARSFVNATCDQQRKAVAAKADALTDVDNAAAKELGVAWSVRYTRKEKSGTTRVVGVMCLPTKAGGFLATSDIVPADQTSLADELTKVMVRMLAAQTKT